MGAALAVYTYGRVQHQDKVSHLGMDLLRAQILTSGLTVGLKYATQRERPDGSNPHSFPSGHASITFATATVIERHLGWRYCGARIHDRVVRGRLAAARQPALAERRGVWCGGGSDRRPHGDGAWPERVDDDAGPRARGRCARGTEDRSELGSIPRCPRQHRLPACSWRNRRDLPASLRRGCRRRARRSGQ